MKKRQSKKNDAKRTMRILNIKKRKFFLLYKKALLNQAEKRLLELVYKFNDDSREELKEYKLVSRKVNDSLSGLGLPYTIKEIKSACLIEGIK